MVFVAILASPYSPVRQILLASYMLFWAFLWYTHFMVHDALYMNYYKCFAILAFFSLWVFARAGETAWPHLRTQPSRPLT
jgi:hypothetical protein